MNPFPRQQQPPQTPANQNQPNPPDHRVDQMVEKMRLLELQNTQLRTQIDHMARPQGQPGQPPKEPLFKPEVQQAIQSLVEERLNTERQQYRQQIGWLADQLDQTKFQTNYGTDKFAKFLPKVEQLRQEYQARNQYITREDALRMVYFEETGKKGVVPDPQAPTPQAAPQPVFDRYLGQYVNPQTGQPMSPEQLQATYQEPEEQEQFQPTAPAQGWQAPQQQQAQQPPQYNTGGMTPGARVPPGMASPYGNAYGQNFSLPNQGVNPSSGTNHSAPQMRGPLSMEASDSDLQAFEAKFGDIPL